MNSNKSAGNIFKEARTKMGLTQLEVAKKAGIYHNTYAKIERDDQKASFPTVKKLARVLDLDIKDIPA